MPDIIKQPSSSTSRNSRWETNKEENEQTLTTARPAQTRQESQRSKWERNRAAYEKAEKSSWTLTTNDGSSYTLSFDQINWIRDRYKKSWTYEDDAEDIRNKQNMVMPKSDMSTYKQTANDIRLYNSGLPSSSELADYIDQYNEYYTLTRGQLQISDDVAAWIRS